MNRFSMVFSRSAEHDLNEIVTYFEPINRTFAIALFGRIRDRIRELYHVPERGRVVPELEHRGIYDYRELIEGNYRIVYSVKETNVSIHSIVDSRRNLEDVLLKKLMEQFE